jgi:hypothetical protein
LNMVTLENSGRVYIDFNELPFADAGNDDRFAISVRQTTDMYFFDMLRLR